MILNKEKNFTLVTIKIITKNNYRVKFLAYLYNFRRIFKYVMSILITCFVSHNSIITFLTKCSPV